MQRSGKDLDAWEMVAMDRSARLMERAEICSYHALDVAGWIS